jgi:lysophospholipase L1-like esterase
MHRIRLVRIPTRLFATLLIIIIATASGRASANPDADGVYVLTQPERTMEQVDKAYAEIPPVRYEPPADRWKNLPHAASILAKDSGELRVVMLGDSIVNDTSRSRWDDVLQRQYPKVKITKVTVVRGGTGCWWYKDPGRVEKYVLPHNPDLLIIGGISQRDDVDSIRDVIGQVRRHLPDCDVLLMTGAFGETDPRDDKQWRFDIDPKAAGYRAKLKRLADDLYAGFLDMTAHWGKYVRDSGKDLAWFKRDPIHANERGEQILGRILAAHLAPPAGG